ncbi:hypothetical protein [Streptomyces sp. NPDC014995]|uniref:hypothetical protein n=1 Tax=Streptomyces sp. NPDC014995 TaxID=3364936 RepID=UPI0036F8F207
MPCAGGCALTRTPRSEAHEPDANRLFDPHNATALRGLARLLDLLPPDPEPHRAL